MAIYDLCHSMLTNRHLSFMIFLSLGASSTRYRPGDTNFFGENVQSFFPSVQLISPSRALDIHECLVFRGEKDDILLSHCLLFARYYICCCKLIDITPPIREYVKHLKHNLKIERQVSIVTDSKDKFQ